MKKLVILSMVILLLLSPVATAVGCQQQPAPTTPTPTPTPTPIPPPTPETLTYTNSEYGFSMEYPEDWDILEDYMGTVVFLGGPAVLEGTYMINISVAAQELPTKMTLEDFVRGGELIDKETIPNYNKEEEYNTTIGGLPTSVQTITGTVELDGEDLLLRGKAARFVKDKFGYIITYDVPTEFHDQYLDYFELVISSFKFE